MSEADDIRRLQLERNGVKKLKVPGNSATKQSLTESSDKDLYTNGNKYEGYNTSIAADDDMDVDQDDGNRLTGQYTATAAQINEFAGGPTQEMDMISTREKQAQIQSRDSDYQRRRFDRDISTATRTDAFAVNGKDGAADGMRYRDVMKENELAAEEERVRKIIEERQAEAGADTDGDVKMIEHAPTLKREDSAEPQDKDAPAAVTSKGRKRRWDVTEETLVKEEDTKKSRWEDTETPAPAPKRRSRWDQNAPVSAAPAPSGQPGATPMQRGILPVGGFGGDVAMRNQAVTDEELDLLLPTEGFKVLTPPPGYQPMPRSLAAANMPSAPVGFTMQDDSVARSMQKDISREIPGVGELQFFKPEDMKYFGRLADNVEEADLGVDELKRRKILKLLLKIKNGTPAQRKVALRQMTDNARSFGAAALFDEILPLLLEKTLEDQERHLLVKVVDRILYKLDDLVRPYTHKILVVIEPLLIDQDHFARVEGKEIIANLAKAAGLAHMISTMRPDLDNPDDYVRNVTARAFAIIAAALGIPALLPFLGAVCRSKKSWQARHTGVKVVQQIAVQMGCAVLPYLKGLVDCVADAIGDEQSKVRTVASLAIAALAEASAPYGIESLDDVLNPLWQGAKTQRGKGLAGFLKAVGCLIPLMDAEYANYYSDNIIKIVTREFQSPDDEMKKVVLKVISQTTATEGVKADFLKANVLPEFFKNFWVRRMAGDKRNYKVVVDTTFDLSQKVGVEEILTPIVNNLRDDNENFRRMSIEAIEKIVGTHGAGDIPPKLEALLVDGALFAFKNQTIEDSVVLNATGTIFNALGERLKSYINSLAATVVDRLDNKSAIIRQQAADLVTRVAPAMKVSHEEATMSRLGELLYEFLGEEYPEVLGSILGAIGAIVSVVGTTEIKPPISTLLPRLTPILRNRHEKVQENTIDLVGRIADRAPESVNAREWMRICFELLDMLKAHKKGIRRAANNTFGFIAKAIGPQDVLSTLLNNLRVQERQSRVCTAVAIGIVAETCAPFTVLPALMVEYRVPELNVQNGVLKSLSFLFEYIGEMAKDYVYAVVPLLEDALVDRDQVHRQTAASVVKHMALGVVGLGCEDAMLHLLNLLHPNIFETSPHVIDRVVEAIDAIRVAVGPGTVMNYVWAGLFHPARKVRTPYWRLFNDAYVQSADALVPYYPPLAKAGGDRDELYMVL